MTEQRPGIAGCKSSLSMALGGMFVAAWIGCSSAPVGTVSQNAPADCAIFPPATDPPDTLVAALVDPVAPENAPVPRNGAELLLFSQVYESLVWLDCTGTVRAGLASSWKRENGGRRWVFELRQDARFWDGTPVRSGHVVNSWRHVPAFRSVVDTIAVQDDRVFAIYPARPDIDVPLVVASAELAVLKETRSGSWRLGTGPMRLMASFPDVDGAPVRIIGPKVYATARMPLVRIAERGPAEARDELDSGADLVVTRDRALIAYASQRPAYISVPGPWDRRYVLLAPARAAAMGSGLGMPGLTGEFMGALARDAVRGDARGAVMPAWWDKAGACPADVVRSIVSELPGSTDSLSRSNRVVYDSGDPVAADLASRIIALAAAAEGSTALSELGAAVPGFLDVGGSLRVDGIIESDLEERLKGGADFLYVVALPISPPDPCYALAELLELAPWLSAADADLEKVLLGLVDTRPTFIGRRGRINLSLDHHGRPRLEGPSPGVVEAP